MKSTFSVCMVFLGCIIVMLCTSSDQSCPTGFTMHPSYRNKCYKVSENKHKWTNSITYCKDMDATVAYVYNEVIHNFVTSLFVNSESNVFIGLTAVSGQYVWLDNDAVEWSIWGTLSLKNDRCVVYSEVSSVWKWTEKPCTSPNYVLCEYTFISGNQTNVILVNGNSGLDGRVEIYHQNRWGTICNSNPGNNLGSVVCNTLGYGFISYLSTSIPGTGRVWLKDVQCNQNETDLNTCAINEGLTWGADSTCHNYDISINCGELIIQTSADIIFTSSTYYMAPYSDTLTLPASTDIWNLVSSTESWDSWSLIPSTDATACSASITPSCDITTVTQSITITENITLTENVTQTESVTLTQNITSTYNVTVYISTTVTVSVTPSLQVLSNQGSTTSTVTYEASTQVPSSPSDLILNNYSVLNTGNFSKRTSAMYSLETKYDMRPSAVAVGTFGILALIFPIVLVILSDILTFKKSINGIRARTDRKEKRKQRGYTISRNDSSLGLVTNGEVLDLGTPPRSHLLHEENMINVSPHQQSTHGKQTRLTRL